MVVVRTMVVRGVIVGITGSTPGPRRGTVPGYIENRSSSELGRWTAGSTAGSSSASAAKAV